VERTVVADHPAAEEARVDAVVHVPGARGGLPLEEEDARGASASSTADGVRHLRTAT